MFTAAIFDMDGLLINSEPMWKIAEQKVFTNVGVNVSKELAIHTASMTTKEVTRFWYKQNPWQGKSLNQVEHEVIDHVNELILNNGESMVGVIDILEYFKSKRFKIGLATNSPTRLIFTVLKKLDISHYFQAITSAEDVKFGKPSPDVYLYTANKLGVKPTRCLVFEDSITGIEAANKANMKTISIPPVTERGNPKFEISAMTLNQLSDFSDMHLEQLTNNIVS